MPTIPMYPGAVETFYEESKASREALDDVLKQYRSNTTTVLALATAGATFFGLADAAKGIFYGLALASYALTALCAVFVYWPKGWRMNVAHDVRDGLASATAALTKTKVMFDLGVGHQTAFTKNLDVLKRIAWLYRGVLVFTAGVVLLAGINTTQEKPEVPSEPTRVVLVEE